MHSARVNSRTRSAVVVLSILGACACGDSPPAASPHHHALASSADAGPPKARGPLSTEGATSESYVRKLEPCTDTVGASVEPGLPGTPSLVGSGASCVGGGLTLTSAPQESPLSEAARERKHDVNRALFDQKAALEACVALGTWSRPGAWAWADVRVDTRQDGSVAKVAFESGDGWPSEAMKCVEDRVLALELPPTNTLASTIHSLALRRGSH